MSDGTERRAWPSRVGRLSGALVLLSLGACASKAPPPVETVRKPEPPPARLAWMPLDAFDVPAVAQVVNDNMSRARPPGTGASTKAAVSMEVAQLAIECIQPTPACYTAVSHSLGADRLMWAELDPSASDDKIKITVVLFDARAGTASRRAGTYDGEQAARVGAADLVAHAAETESAAQ
jgi:hypothetical protein